MLPAIHCHCHCCPCHLQLMSDVFDLLLSLGDFESFREIMLSYKRELTQGGSAFQIQVRKCELPMNFG